MSDERNTELTPLWTWLELTRGLTGTAKAGPDVVSVSVDSRKIHPGALFVALPGDPGPRFNPSYRSQVDGHDYVQSAALAGAAGALIHKKIDKGSTELDLPANFELIQVEDTYDGLWSLGRLARTRLSGDVVAVTGSSGKTTAKHFLSQALAAYAPPGSFNNHIGVPLSLANTPAASTAAIYEIGTNHPGEIAPLAEIVAADVAILLNVHVAHIENFPNRDALYDEKISIFNSLTNKSNAISEDVLDLGFGLTFGETPGADARILSLDGDSATIKVMGARLVARIPGGGLHRAKTLAATLLACQLLGRDTAPACELPADTIPVGRGNIHQIGTVRLIDDSYNANPDSMSAALKSFAELPGLEQRVAIIGEMLELGEVGPQAHMELASTLEQMDAVYCVGQGTQALAATLKAPWRAQVDESLVAEVASTLKPNSGVMVKGSNRVFWANDFVGMLSSAIHALHA